VRLLITPIQNTKHFKVLTIPAKSHQCLTLLFDLGGSNPLLIVTGC